MAEQDSRAWSRDSGWLDSGVLHSWQEVSWCIRGSILQSLTLVGMIPDRILSMKDVSSGPRPLALTSLQVLFQSVVGDRVSHFSGVRGVSDSSFCSGGTWSRITSEIRKFYTSFRVQFSIEIEAAFIFLIVGKKSPAKLGGISGLGRDSSRMKYLYSKLW